MFGRLTRLFRRDPDRARYVFAYGDGSRKRWADPVAAERVLIDRLGADWWETVAGLSDQPPLGVLGVDADAHRAKKDADRTAVLAAVDAAFGVEPFRCDATTDFKRVGLTEIERLGLLTGYVLFCAALAKLARPFVTAQPREPPSPAGPPPPSSAASTSPIPAPA